jgi:hypothetical protein
MSTVVALSPVSARRSRGSMGRPRLEERARGAARLFGEQPSRQRPVTLSDLILATCDELEAGHSIACPVCSGSMAPRTSAVGVSGGRCGDCDATLG